MSKNDFERSHWNWKQRYIISISHPLLANLILDKRFRQHIKCTHHSMSFKHGNALTTRSICDSTNNNIVGKKKQEIHREQKARRIRQVNILF